MSGTYENPVFASASEAVLTDQSSVSGSFNRVTCEKAVFVSDKDGVFPSMNISLITENMTPGYDPHLWFYNVNHDFNQLWYNKLTNGVGGDFLYFPEANVSFTVDPAFEKRAFFKIKPPNNSHGKYLINIYYRQIIVFLIDASKSQFVSPLRSIVSDLTGTSSLNSNLSGLVHDLNGSATIEFQAKSQDGESVPYAPFILYKNSDTNTNPVFCVSDANGVCIINDSYVEAYRNKYVPYILTQYNSAVRLAQLSIPWFAGGILPSPPNTLKISCSSTGVASGITTFYNGTGATLTVSNGTPNKSFVVKNVTDNIILWNGLFDSQGNATVYISNTSTAAYITKTYTVESVGNTASCTATWYNVGGFYLKSNSGYSFTRTDSSAGASLNPSAITLGVAFSAGPGIFYYGTQVTFHVVDRTSGGAIVGANDGVFAPFTQTLTTGAGTVNLPSEWLTSFAAYPGTYNIIATARWNNFPFWWIFVLDKPLVVIPASLTKTNILNSANKATTPMVMTGVNISALLTSTSPAIAKYVNTASATVVIPAIDNDGVSSTYTGFVDAIPAGGVMYIPSKAGDTFIIQYKQYTVTFVHLQNGDDNITVVSSGGTQNFNPVSVGGSYFIGTQRFVRIAGGSGLYAADYDVVCFLTDAPVLTPSGYKAIGSLKVGDLVMTADGSSSPITKVNVQHVNPCSETNPYSIPKGQFGATRRLLISPNHKVLVEGRGLVEARKLGLEQKSMTKSFDYYNLELESSKNMIVAGVTVESLAPKRRFILSAEEFRTLVLRNYGRMTPEVQERLRTVSRVLADGRVEFIATAQR